MSTPIYVKIEQYKELQEMLARMDEKITQAATLLEKIEHLKAHEEEELKRWVNSLQALKARSGEINKALFSEK